MNSKLLIDAIVRQTTVLIAQLATQAGNRTPLAHTANQVFLSLVKELRRQGLGNKVIADMFGLALRTYHDKVQRLSESQTFRGRSLWEAVLQFVQEHETVTQPDILLRFSNDDEQVRPMGRDAAGVRGMKLREGDQVVGAGIARDEQVLLSITENGWGKRTRVSEFPAQGRGGLGVKAIKLVSTRGNVVAAYVVDREDTEVMLVSSGGVVIRVRVGDIGHQPLGRDAMGVRVMTLDDSQQVASVAPILGGTED